MEFSTPNFETQGPLSHSFFLPPKTEWRMEVLSHPLLNSTSSICCFCVTHQEWTWIDMLMTIQSGKSPCTNRRTSKIRLKTIGWTTKAAQLASVCRISGRLLRYPLSSLAGAAAITNRCARSFEVVKSFFGTRGSSSFRFAKIMLYIRYEV